MKSRLRAERYAAMLLFQFRVEYEGDSGIRRTCEKRLFVLEATSAQKALSLAKRRGRAAEGRYKNSLGGTVHFEFVGVQDLLHLGPECEDDEMWYDIVELVRPMERRKKLIPAENELQAIAEEGYRQQRGRRSAANGHV